jgi:DNA (cytosine-5)-methyltransferase 1
MTVRQLPCLLAPQVGAWIGSRLRAVIHTRQDSGPEIAAAA